MDSIGRQSTYNFGTGRYTGENHTLALCGFVRAMGEADDSINRLAQKDGYLKGVWSGSR